MMAMPIEMIDYPASFIATWRKARVARAMPFTASESIVAPSRDDTSIANRPADTAHRNLSCESWEYATLDLSTDCNRCYWQIFESIPRLVRPSVATARGALMFAFFSSRTGCIGSIIVSILGTLLLTFVLRGCRG